VPAAILSNVLRAHLADTVLTSLLTYDEAPTCQRGWYSSRSPWVDIIPTRAIPTSGSWSGRNCRPNDLTNVRPVRLAISEGKQR
jgi:hypothetical protein